MNYENFTIKTQAALQDASSIAIKNDNSEIAPEHVLQALLEQEDGLIKPIIERIGVNSKDLLIKVKDLINTNPKVSGSVQVYFSNDFQKILAKSEIEMETLHDSFLSTEHILLAMSKSECRTGDLLRKLGINHEAIIESLISVRGNQSVDSQDPESKTRSLEKYCRDLTAAAKQDKILYRFY